VLLVGEMNNNISDLYQLLLSQFHRLTIEQFRGFRFIAQQREDCNARRTP